MRSKIISYICFTIVVGITCCYYYNLGLILMRLIAPYIEFFNG